MSKTIEFQIERGYAKKLIELGGKKAVKLAANATLMVEGELAFELSILICGDAKIQELNKNYRNKDKSTDVLSFPAPGLKNDSVRYLGDLIISLPTVEKNAPKFQNNPAQELLRVTIHGVLHLLGYDHEGVNSTIAKKMRKKESEILAFLKAGKN